MLISIMPANMQGVYQWIFLAIFALWLATIIEVSISKFPSKGDKWLWLIVVILLGGIGCLIYFIAGRKHRITE